MKETQVKRVRKAGLRKNVKVSKIRRGQSSLKRGRRKKGEFRVECKTQVESKEEKEKLVINEAMEEKMKTAALKCGMGYDQFTKFLRKLTEDEKETKGHDTSSDEMSESESDSYCDSDSN